MQAYIKGVGIISPQKTFNTTDFLTEIISTNTNYLKCIEPPYLEFLNPIMARRMGRIIKMGMAASSICLRDANITMPDAIITGTALGCLGDMEKFLQALIVDDELYLTPTPFIQSIQNTVGAQIALQLKCTNHNFTHSHKGFSFESAALDAMMLLSESDDEKNILVGGLDEMTSNNFFLFNRINRWKKENINSINLINYKSTGTIAGEGAAFFVFSNKANENNYAVIKGIETIYKPDKFIAVENKISKLLSENNLSENEIDLVLYGINGDDRYDAIHYAIKDGYFKNSSAAYFKNLCGEYQTSSSFALWMAAMILKKQHIPAEIIIEKKPGSVIQSIIICNNYESENWSVTLISVI